MTEGISNNLNAHYSTQTKVERPKYVVANPVQSVPVYDTYTDIKGTKRWNSINQEIDKETVSMNKGLLKHKKTKKSAAMKKIEGDKFDSRKFLKVFLGIVAAVLAVIGIKKVFKKS